MYRVVKEIGVNENVFLQNTDTMAEVNLGRITPTICRILEKDGYSLGEIYTGTAVTLKEKWTLNISDEVKDELRKLAMPINKPIRDQRKVKQEEKKVTTQPVDILDIIYGLA
jgi:hypothetical protein